MSAPKHKLYTEQFAPFTPVQLMVFTRMYASGPFTCRIRTRAGKPPLVVTVLGVVMPQTEDPKEEPVLHYVPADRYLEAITLKPLRESVTERLNSLLQRVPLMDSEILTELENRLGSL